MSTEIPLILSLDVSGIPHRWINYEQAAYYYAKGLVAWTLGADDYTLMGGTRRIDGERSKLSMNSIIAVKGQTKVEKLITSVPPLTNKALFRRDLNVCGYCGSEFSTSNLTRDHVHPRSKGGADDWTNVVSACGSCNRRKAARTPEQASMDLLYVPYAPNRAEYLILMNRKILADQMQYLLRSVPKHSRMLLQ